MKKRKLVQTVLSVLLCTMIIFSLCGCKTEKLPYNIEVFHSGYEYIIREDIKTAYRTYGVIIYHDEIDESGGVRSIGERDRESPRERYIIIQNSEKIDDYFTRFDEVDFETKMIVMVFFTDYNGSSCYVHYANIEGTALKIQFSSRVLKGTATGIEPGIQNCLVMKMDKHDITEVKRV